MNINSGVWYVFFRSQKMFFENQHWENNKIESKNKPEIWVCYGVMVTFVLMIVYNFLFYTGKNLILYYNYWGWFQHTVKYFIHNWKGFLSEKVLANC